MTYRESFNLNKKKIFTLNGFCIPIEFKFNITVKFTGNTYTALCHEFSKEFYFSVRQTRSKMSHFSV